MKIRDDGSTAINQSIEGVPVNLARSTGGAALVNLARSTGGAAVVFDTHWIIVVFNAVFSVSCGFLFLVMFSGTF